MQDMWEERLELYDRLVDKCPRLEERKNHAVHLRELVYVLTAQQGGRNRHSVFQARSGKVFGSSKFMSYGAEMRGYVLIPDHMLDDLDKLSEYLNESYDYVMSLDPK
jgi:hypothetical protein